MRRLFAAVMTAVMLAMCVQPCFAAGIDNINDLPETLAMRELTITVGARKSNTDDEFENPLNLRAVGSSKGVDYKVELDMTPVKTIYSSIADKIDPDFITSDAYRNAVITTEIDVVITYPETAEIVGNFMEDGGLDYGDTVFEERKPRLHNEDDRTVTVYFGIKEDINSTIDGVQSLTVGDLMDSPTYLNNPVFVLDDAVKYDVGTHEVKIEMSGWTKITFDEGVNPDNAEDDIATTVEYTGETTHKVIARSGGGGGGGSSTPITNYELAYNSNGGTAFNTESYKEDQVVNINKVPVREGYVFDGWYIDSALTSEVTSVKMTGNTTVHAKWVKERPPVPEMLNGVDHFAYVIGYPDGTVRPNNNITRAEVTTIFFRLLKDEIRDTNLTEENIFDDVNDGDWHNAAVSTMAKLGIINGRETNMFVPDAFITRAEFTTICARFENLGLGVTNNFSDIDGHWAKDDILEAAAYGWIEGYDDGTFRPDDCITRAEAMTLINRVLNRVHRNHTTLLEGMAEWSDNKDTSAWYYTAVQEATNSNEYEHINSVYKKWSSLKENRDWSVYED